jgi:hypothetical protein
MTSSELPGPEAVQRTRTETMYVWFEPDQVEAIVLDYAKKMLGFSRRADIQMDERVSITIREEVTR